MSHRPNRIAHSAVAAVDACSCETVHVHIGTVTLHLTPQALRSLAHTLQAATLRLEGQQRDAWPITTSVAGTC